MGFSVDRAIVLAAHTDDGEVACGGTIAKLLENGTDVYYAAFSICEKSVPEGFREDILASEVMDATAALGIPETNVMIYRFPVRRLPEHRQDILEELVKMNREIKPSLIMLPSRSDIHQDHVTVHHEGVRAFKKTTVIGYELPMNNLESNPSLYIKLEIRHLQMKGRAIAKYKSQAHRGYGFAHFLPLANLRGHQVGVDYAEAFEVVRLVVE